MRMLRALMAFSKETYVTQSRMRYAPVVMAIASVPMNGGLFPESEMKPDDWVGKPVTIAHPTIGGRYRGARDSDAVGEIVNAWVEDGKLKGVIKVDVTRAGRLADSIERGEEIDVSTGYFASDECPREGGPCVHRNIRPDHLAIVSQGACSWDDGCGIRSNLRTNHVTKTRFQSNKRRYSDRRPSLGESLQDALDEALAPLTEMMNQLNGDRALLDNCACRSIPVANSSGDPEARRAMSLSEREAPLNANATAKGMIAHMNEFNRDMERRRQRSLDYCARNPVQRRDNAVTANRNDPAFQAMNGESLADAVRRKREGK
jgi:hypothetical protein